MSGRIYEVLRVLVAFTLGGLLTLLLCMMTNHAREQDPQTTTGEESLVTTALYIAARAVIEQGYHFESESAIAGWRDGLEEIRHSNATQFTCMDDRTCTRDEWLIDCVRYFGTLAFESGSQKPVAKWMLAVRNAVDGLDKCSQTNQYCFDEAGVVLMIALTPPVF